MAQSALDEKGGIGAEYLAGGVDNVNYYQHHIGDFDRATRHLSRLERSIYRDMLDVYYDTEVPLTLDLPALCRKIIAKSNEEATAVEQVLNEFFTKTPTGWYHARCEDELEAYRTSTSQKSQAGKASAVKRALKRQQALNGIPTSVEQPSNGTPTNQEPITNNHKPSKSKTRVAPAMPLPDWVPADAFDAFVAMRKAIRKPITADGIPLAVKKLEKLRANGSDPRAVLEQSTLNSWQGLFEVKSANHGPPGYQSQNDKAKDFANSLTGKNRNEQPNIIDLNDAPA